MSRDKIHLAALVWLRTGQLKQAELKKVGVLSHPSNADRMEIQHEAGVIACQALRAIPARKEYRSEYR